MIDKFRNESNKCDDSTLQKCFKEDVLDEQQYHFLLEIFGQFNETLKSEDEFLKAFKLPLNEKDGIMVNNYKNQNNVDY